MTENKTVTTMLHPSEHKILCRISAAEGVSVYRTARRALLLYLVEWMQQHPEMEDYVLRPD